MCRAIYFVVVVFLILEIGCATVTCRRPPAFTESQLMSTPPPAAYPAPGQVETFATRAALFEAVAEAGRRVAVKDYARAREEIADFDRRRLYDLTTQAEADVRKNGPFIDGRRTWAITARGQLVFVNPPTTGGTKPDE